MSSTELVFAGPDRAVLQGVSFPAKPPTRVYIGDQVYKLVGPRVALPPIINVVKAVLNWVNTAGRIAKNIWHLKTPTSFVTSDPAALSGLADIVLTTISASSALASQIASAWTLSSVTCHDLAGTSAVGNSTATAMPGTNAAPSLPPQTAVVLSWQIAASYRGGKPRTYVPGIPTNAVLAGGSSQLTSAYATAMQLQAAAILTTLNGATLSGGGHPTLGTVSYYHGHAVRPTPIFEQYSAVKVHERLDSQRRRSGAESSFPSVP